MTRRTVYIGTGVVLALLVALAFGFCRPKPTPIPRKEQKTIDSLDATKPAADSVRHGTQDTIIRVITKIVHDETVITTIRAEADREHRRADSLARVALDSGVSGASWRGAYDARTREAGALRVAVDTLTTRLQEAKGALLGGQQQIRADSTRLARTDDLNARLARDLQRASPPCHVAHFFACPSRTVAFVSGVVVASAGAYAVTHRSQLSKLAGVIP